MCVYAGYVYMCICVCAHKMHAIGIIVAILSACMLVVTNVCNNCGYVKRHANAFSRFVLFVGCEWINMSISITVKCRSNCVGLFIGALR